jgi:hypothetical protein
LVTTMSSPSASSSNLQLAVPSANAKKRRLDDNTCRQLVSQERQSKTAIANLLKFLQRKGCLEAGATRRQLSQASAHHAQQDTPYGKVVQRIELNLPKLKYIDIVHPFALLYYLCQISVVFANMMHGCSLVGNALRLVVYSDGMNPGNPFRPEKSRKLTCVYWAFVDWPAHMLSRTFAWPPLLIMRETVIKQIPGAMAYMNRLILRLFFPEEGHSFARGIYLPLREASFMVCAIVCRFSG